MQITAFDFNVFHVEAAGGEIISLAAVDQGIQIKTRNSELTLRSGIVSEYISGGKTIIKKGEVLNDNEKKPVE